MAFPWDVKIFGQRLRRLRDERNLTQESLAATLGCSTETVSRWETGQRPPQKSYLQALATRYFGSQEIKPLVAGLPLAAP